MTPVGIVPAPRPPSSDILDTALSVTTHSKSALFAGEWSLAKQTRTDFLHASPAGTTRSPRTSIPGLSINRQMALTLSSRMFRAKNQTMAGVCLGRGKADMNEEGWSLRKRPGQRMKGAW